MLNAPDALAGKKARCPCGGVVPIPAAKVVGACPGCGAMLSHGDVLCTTCGMDLRTGRRLAGPSAASDETAPTPRKPLRTSSSGSNTARAPAIKLFIWLGLLTGLGLFFWLTAFGGFGGMSGFVHSMVTFDPAKQRLQKLAAITPGMSMKQVVDVAGRPQEVYIHLDYDQQQKYGVSSGHAKIPYDENLIAAQGPEKLQNGYFFIYRFNAGGDDLIDFDPAGNVVGKEFVPNMFNR